MEQLLTAYGKVEFPPAAVLALVNLLDPEPLLGDSLRGLPKAKMTTTAMSKSPVIEPNNLGYGIGESTV